MVGKRANAVYWQSHVLIFDKSGLYSSANLPVFNNYLSDFRCTKLTLEPELITLTDFLFWLAFGVSILPGIGNGFFGMLVSLVFGFFFACGFAWLSEILLLWTPLRLFPSPEAARPHRFFIDTAFFVLCLCLLAGILFIDRRISVILTGYFFGKFPADSIPQ